MFFAYSTSFAFNARYVWYSLPDSYIHVESCLLAPLFFLFWVFRFAHVQLRSFLPPFYLWGFSREKKYQALSACINSISCSGVEKPGNEAIVLLLLHRWVILSYLAQSTPVCLKPLSRTGITKNSMWSVLHVILLFAFYFALGHLAFTWQMKNNCWYKENN